MYPTKIKKVGRILKILLKNVFFSPLNIQSSRKFIKHIYNFDPIDISSSSHVERTNFYDLFKDPCHLDVAVKDLRLSYGAMGYSEIYIIALIVKFLKPKKIFEFGTFDGTTTLQLAMNSTDKTRIYTLDLPSCNIETKYTIGTSELDLNLPAVQSGTKFKDTPEAKKITQLFGDSAAFDYTPYYDQIDFIIIDASHEYNYVKNDTEQAMKMLKKPGVILWHDYPNASGVVQYVEEIAREKQVYLLDDTHLAVYIAK